MITSPLGPGVGTSKIKKSMKSDPSLKRLAVATNLLLCCLLAGMSVLLTACGSGGGSQGTGTNSISPAITTQPTNQSVSAGEPATFTAVATGTGPLTFEWFMNGTEAGGNSNTYTISVNSMAENGAQIYVKVTNSAGTATSNTVALNVSASAAAPSISQQPTSATVTAGQTASFTVQATGAAPLTYQWFMNGTAVGTNSNTYAVIQTTSGQSGAQIYVAVTSASGTAASTTVTLTVLQAGFNVLTYHNDLARTGQNLSETSLTAANVNSTSFGKLGNLAVDAGVDAEPLYVSNLVVAGSARNVVYVATENDSVYAFDADTFVQLWKASVLGPNETASDSRGCSQVSPIIGITSTPVIDLSAGPHGEIFLVAMSLDNGGNYYQRVHALDLTTGGEISGSPIAVQASYPTVSGTTTFEPKKYKERAALLLLNGVIYTTWASHCDSGPYTGWVIGYNETSLQQASVLDLTPNGSDGAIWMAGDGPAADSSGNIYFLDANGTFDDTLDSNSFPEHGDFGNSFIKISTANASLSVADYFTMYNSTVARLAGHAGQYLAFSDWRRQRRPHLRRESRSDGQIQYQQRQWDLSGNWLDRTGRRGVFHARILQQYGVLRSGRRSPASVFHCERQAQHPLEFTERSEFCLSWRDPEYFGERLCERHRLGG
jgi:hypothetical protein